MRRTEFFFKTNKNIKHDNTLLSHKLLLQSGMIEQQSSGLYVFSPLATRVLNKISNIIRSVFEKNGFAEIIMPIMQPEEIWHKSGRVEIYGEETLKAVDRNNKTLIFSPTNEEIVTDYFSKIAQSYKHLPISMYQINWKFRDEIRPRFGLMRAREFLMMDLYSFDKNKEDALKTYTKVFNAYNEIFSTIKLPIIPTRADNGVIGGDFSHEFHILTHEGDSVVYYQNTDIQFMNNINDIVNIDSAVEEKKDTLKNNISTYKTSKGIEIGHLFYFGDKYTKAMNVELQDANNSTFFPHMGSYGIGVSRMLQSVIESSHDKNGIIFPETIAPFRIYIVDMLKNEQTNEIYQKFCKEYNNDVILDDRDCSFGEKINDAELIGSPDIVILGKQFAENGTIERKKR